MTDLAFVDTETTGLDPVTHQIWEVGLITRSEGEPDREFRWQLPVDLGKADPKALEIGRFHERYDVAALSVTRSFCTEFSDLTDGRHLVGAVISFDAERLSRLIRSATYKPALVKWHYHLVDVEALIAGKLQIPPPWKSDDLSRAVGVDPEQFDRHTAIGDCRWAKALYDAVMA